MRAERGLGASDWLLWRVFERWSGRMEKEEGGENV